MKTVSVSIRNEVITLVTSVHQVEIWKDNLSGNGSKILYTQQRLTLRNHVSTDMNVSIIERGWC